MSAQVHRKPAPEAVGEAPVLFDVTTVGGRAELLRVLSAENENLTEGERAVYSELRNEIVRVARGNGSVEAVKKHLTVFEDILRAAETSNDNAPQEASVAEPEKTSEFPAFIQRKRGFDAPTVETSPVSVAERVSVPPEAAPESALDAQEETSVPHVAEVPILKSPLRESLERMPITEGENLESVRNTVEGINARLVSAAHGKAFLWLNMDIGYREYMALLLNIRAKLDNIPGPTVSPQEASELAAMIVELTSKADSVLEAVGTTETAPAPTATSEKKAQGIEDVRESNKLEAAIPTPPESTAPRQPVVTVEQKPALEVASEPTLERVNMSSDTKVQSRIKERSDMQGYGTPAETALGAGVGEPLNIEPQKEGVGAGERTTEDAPSQLPPNPLVREVENLPTPIPETSQITEVGGVEDPNALNVAGTDALAPEDVSSSPEISWEERYPHLYAPEITAALEKLLVEWLKHSGLMGIMGPSGKNHPDWKVMRQEKVDTVIHTDGTIPHGIEAGNFNNFVENLREWRATYALDTIPDEIVENFVRRVVVAGTIEQR